mmetsp:Transcript_57417/g.121833  ORF Transcript_57417/g.121833 Transcript_57417/m.121833 type:complete len:766 (-) Transcript_57417:81-2378(-)
MLFPTLLLLVESSLIQSKISVMALVPSSSLSRRVINHAPSYASRTNPLPIAANIDSNVNYEPPLFGRRVRQDVSSKLSHMMGTNYKNDAHCMESPSLFAKRHPSKRRTTITSLMLLLLRRLITPSIAWASEASSLTPTSPSFPLGRRRVLTNLRSVFQSTIGSLGKLSKQQVKRIFLAGLTVLLFKSVIESVMAYRRQKIDATSEWGRYSDQPAARGMALTVLMMILTPYALLPVIIEKITGKNKESGDNYIGYNTKEEYESSRAHRLRKKGGRLFADGLLRLGPLYIKIGQILSCRENLFPDEWIAGMEKLQDRVPAKSGEEAWALAYEACPGGKAGFHQKFTDFDDVPLAAASLGQVHKARLRSSGERVAIKIQRPRLRDIYDKDLVLMKKIAKVVDFFGKAGQVGGVEQSWVGIFDDAETILYREIDYRDEAENAIQFANDFGIGLGGVAIDSTARVVDGKTKLASAAEWLRTPYTYGDLSSEKFLVMEYVPSIKVTNNAKLDEAGVTVEDREYLAEALAHSYLRQFCANKFFSTDPHPGNLGIEVFEDGRAPRMVFYDFGQACSLSDDQAGGILEVIESIIDSDAKKSVAAFSRMGVLKDNADLGKVQAKCQQNYDTGKLKVKKRKKRSKYSSDSYVDGASQLEARIEQAEKVSNVVVSTPEVKDTEVMEYFTLQSEYAFVARALSQMDGVGKSLDPEFDFISAAAPYLVEVKGAGRYLVDEAKKRLKFVYDPGDGVLAKEMALFKLLGFDPAEIKTSNRK